MKKVLFSFLLIFVFAMPAFSQMGDMHMKGHGGGGGPMMEKEGMDMMGGSMMCFEHMRHMGFSDDQMAKIKPIHREMQKKKIRLDADLKIAEIELMDVMEVKDFDLNKATSALKKIEEIKTARHLEMLKAMKEIRAVMTDEQFKNMPKMCMMKEGKKHGKMMMNKPAAKHPGTKQPTAEPKTKPQADASIHKH